MLGHIGIGEVLSARHDINVNLVEEGANKSFEARIGVTNVFIDSRYQQKRND